MCSAYMYSIHVCTATCIQVVSPHCHNVYLLLVGLVRLPDILHVCFLKVFLPVLKELDIAVDKV